MGEWYRDFFGPDYLKAYGPRNRREAPAEVAFIETALEMRTSGLYLDLCCGEGRHAVPLAGKGYRICGLDWSASLLEAARGSAQRVGVQVEWIRGDFREIPFREIFDGVYCWFTSFGYFSDPADDLRVLAETSRSVRPGGSFLLEVLNPAFVAAHPRETKRIDGDGCHLDSEMTFLPEFGIAATRKTVHYPDGVFRTFSLKTRIYSRVELAGMLVAAGWERVAVLEGGEPVPRTLRYLVRKPGRPES